ncbi:sperm-specific sodium:proton exchanger-like isoform X2 [Atheta coriaria]
MGLLYMVGGDQLEISSRNMMGKIATKYVIDGYVPIFIVSTMYRINYPNFLKYLPQVMLITFFGGVISPLLLGFILSRTMNNDLTFTCGVMRAIAVVPIEPLYAVGILKRLARFKYLETILEAESVILMIPVYLMLDMFHGIQIGNLTEWYHVMNLTLRHAIFGFAIGYLAGKLHVLCMVYIDSETYYTFGVSIFMTYGIYVLTEFLAFGNAQLALLCNICQVLSKRHKLSPQVDANVVEMWATIQYLSETVWLTFVTIQFTLYLAYNFYISMAYGAILIYITTLFLRLVGLVLLSPLLWKMSNEINLKAILVLTWSGIRGPMALNFSQMFFNCKVITKTDSFLFEVFVTVLIGLLLNSSSMKQLLRMIGYSRLSTSQRTNMNLYVDMLNKKAQYIIYNLKFRRYFVGTYWVLVRDFVKLNYSSDEADDNYKSHIFEGKACDHCEMDVPYNITESELSALLLENETKITKLKKIFLINQYLRGSIDKRCLELITKKLERKLDFSRHRQTCIELSVYFKPGKVLKCCHIILKKLSATPKIIPPPRTCPMRQLVYYFTMHIAYDYVMYAITLANSIFILWNVRYCCNWMFDYHVALWCFYIGDFVLKIYGLSHKRLITSACEPYFSKKSNWIDAFCLWVTPISLFFVGNNALFGWTVFYIVPSVRLIAALRLLTFFSLLYPICPILLKYIEYKSNLRTCFGYELGFALTQCDNDVLAVLQEILELKTIRNVFRKEMIGNKEALERQMLQMQREKPYIALTVKTKQAIQITLNALKRRLQELQQFSIFELRECNYIAGLLAQQQKNIKAITIVQTYSTHEILKSIPWIGTNGLYEYFFPNVKMISWNAGDLVQSKGKVSQGIYVIVTGMLRLHLMSNMQELSNDGSLPIIDNLSSVDYSKAEELLLSGDIVGELSFITGRPYDCNIVAESFCQAYWFTPELLQKGYETYNNPVIGLECQIWRNCCLKITIAILMKIPVYETRTQAEIKQNLDHCFMPNLRCYKTFVLTDKISDVLLIEGRVKSALTGEIFKAPMLIPHAVQRILLTLTSDESLFSQISLQKMVRTKLMIVPIDGVTPIEVMREEEELAEFIVGTSSQYLLTHKSLKKSRVTSFTNVPVENVDSLSMKSYEWRADKEVTPLDPVPDVFLKLNSSFYDESREMLLMQRSRRVRMQSSSNLSRLLDTPKQIDDLSDED